MIHEPKKDGRNSAIIVASGPSALDVMDCHIDSRQHAIISVNGSADWLPHFDYWFTLDLTPANLLRMRKKNKTAQYFVALPSHKSIPEDIIRFERNSVDA